MKDNLSRQEWVLMETLWNRNPLFLSDIKEDMDDKVHWKNSTYLTYLKKMCDRGYIGFKEIRGSRSYYPLMNREDCVTNESRNMLGRMTNSSRKIFLTAMLKESGLSEKDRDDLQNLITELGKK